MGQWDDAEVDSDGEELLDWLWDFPDRYEVGIDDDPTATAGTDVGGLDGLTGVRKHLRAAGEPTVWDDDRPTAAVAPPGPLVLPFAIRNDGYESEFGAALSPAMAAQPRRGRFTAREWKAGAAVLLVVVVGAGLGAALFNNGSGKPAKPSNLAIGTPTTPVTIFDPSPAPPMDIPTTVDTTPTSQPTTTTLPTSSVPAIVALATTSTTARHCAVRMAELTPPVDPAASSTSTTTTTTTTTTVPQTTTTSITTTTTVAPTTTTVTTPPWSTTPPTTAPPTTVRCH